MCRLAFGRLHEAKTAVWAALARHSAYSYARAQLELVATTAVLDQKCGSACTQVGAVACGCISHTDADQRKKGGVYRCGSNRCTY